MFTQAFIKIFNNNENALINKLNIHFFIYIIKPSEHYFLEKNIL
jgi:hypothetical protein